MIPNSDGDYYGDVNSYYGVLGESLAAKQLEQEGWQRWLKTVGANTFTGDFGFFHAEFWDWFWRITEKRRQHLPLTGEELAFLAIWARGCGKSSVVEWAAIAEGALVGTGFVLYVCANQANAERHVESIRARIEGDAVTSYYPQLAQPKVGKQGNRFGWRQDFLATASGWAILPLGLDVAVRGVRFGDTRPTLIIFDDIDETDDSPHVVEKKLDTIARKIIPAGTRNTIKLFAQNLIHETSVANLIYSGKTDVLARRIESGAHPAFSEIEIDSYTDEGTGKPRHLITHAVPTWEYFDIDSAQQFLDDSGRDGFLAEYQHDFSADQQDRVIPEYDERVHVITWSQFEAKFGTRHIPPHWYCGLGLDLGYSNTHLSAWTWETVSAKNSALPGKWFRYRGLTFQGVSIDDQAEAAIKAMQRTEGASITSEVRQIKVWRMSHEKLGERITLNNKYKLPFLKCKSGKEDGLAQWRHFLRVDKHKPHPFHEDLLLADGTYSLGCPGWFDIVADDQLYLARDDAGLITHRRQTRAWKRRRVVLTASGLQDDLPLKADEDTCDSTRMVTAQPELMAAPLTIEEEMISLIPDAVKIDYSTRGPDNPVTLAEEKRLNFARFKAQQEMARKYSWDNDDEDDY